VTIEIASGEIIGVVGRNGSGKSTLLKVIAGILPPTNGRVQSVGYVAALVELGAGFHPELSAYENILIYGRMLGMKVEYLENHAKDILIWAGLERHRNDPVRTFSSGMVSRLGFAIATHRSPDILLVDEVLSVGDGEFQSRASSRMLELMSGGTTVVLVSHDLTTIGNLCSRVLWLENGNMKEIGSPTVVLQNYQHSIS
jgi:ABC-type polysaccharide/polyol phosphate transport system ATPase subunit